jgi:hypothetical protein
MIDRKGAEAAADALDGADMNGKQLTVKINEETSAKPNYAPKAFSPQRQPVIKKYPGQAPRNVRKGQEGLYDQKALLTQSLSLPLFTLTFEFI